MSNGNERAMTGGEKTVHAVDKLREAIAKAIDESADEIAQGMMERCKDGDPRCVKLAEDIAERHKEEQSALERRSKSKRSLALEWANEPEWTEEDERALHAQKSKTA